MKKILFLILSVLLLVFPLSLRATTQLCAVDFEDNLTDSIALITLNFYNTTGITYVTGNTNKAARSSHNSDDGTYNDFIIQIGDGQWNGSDNLYVTYYIKFETGYGTGDDVGNWNFKLFWSTAYLTPGQELHLQNMAGGVSNHRWIMAGGATWNCENAGAKYFNGTLSHNTWHKVEWYVQASTGATNLNCDGINRFWIDDVLIYEDVTVQTGLMDNVFAPSINGTGDPTTGNGWWQIDDYEVWDGMPAAEPDVDPPIISNPRPDVDQPSGTSTVDIQVDTSENATCKYDTSDDTYDNLSNTFSTTGAKAHLQNITSLSDGNTYTYYCRCMDGSSNKNTSSTVISFQVLESDPDPPPEDPPGVMSTGVTGANLEGGSETLDMGSGAKGYITLQ